MVEGRLRVGQSRIHWFDRWAVNSVWEQGASARQGFGRTMSQGQSKTVGCEQVDKEVRRSDVGVSAQVAMLRREMIPKE
jgi:hypothetical protein